MADEETKVVPPAKVHGDSGVTAVVAEVDDPEAEDIEAMKDQQVRTEESKDRGPSGTVEAGMRS